MSTGLLERPETVIPSGSDVDLATEASRTLAAHRAPGNLRVRLDDDKEILLPHAARDLLAYLLTEMARGNAVTVIPIHAELTTQEAADLLNVSRPYLIKLLDSEKIPFHKAGTHRRIRMADLEMFRKRLSEEREQAMDELTIQAQKAGMGY